MKLGYARIKERLGELLKKPKRKIASTHTDNFCKQTLLMPQSFLRLVTNCDVAPYPVTEYASSSCDTTKYPVYRFLSGDGIMLGKLTEPIYKALKEYSKFFSFTDTSVSFISRLDTIELRNAAIASILENWKKTSKFAILKGWRDELYTVYDQNHAPYLRIERAGAALFGVVTYGVHIVGYVPANEELDVSLRFWIPRRSPNKPTFPNMLDNTVAGGLGYPYGVTETCIKECYEEAGLSEEYVTKRLRSVGAISYEYQFDYEKNESAPSGLYQPEVEYLFDLEMDSDTVPTPVDNEVAEFNLMTVDEVKTELLANNFKPNTALVMIDFFIRHGIITPENEPNILEIQSRLHRKLEYPLR